MPSLGLPTWVYGHEPPNSFATWHGTFFNKNIKTTNKNK